MFPGGPRLALRRRRIAVVALWASITLVLSCLGIESASASARSRLAAGVSSVPATWSSSREPHPCGCSTSPADSENGERGHPLELTLWLTDLGVLAEICRSARVTPSCTSPA